MRAAYRLIRASLVFAIIFESYLWQASLARLWPARFATRWPLIHRRNARRLYRAFVGLRGVYIKLGQILSVMGSFLPAAYVEELKGLQDEVPPLPYRRIARSFVREFGISPTEAFASFGKMPIAAASLGQVHEATSRDGAHLAVKILYPDVAAVIRVDLRVLGWALDVYRVFVPIQQIERVHEQLTDMLARESDLVNEARCIATMTQHFADDEDVLLPTVEARWSGPTVLTMSFMEGEKLSRPEAFARLGLEREAVATKLTQVFFKQLFVDRFFHADPHPGNFFVQRNPETNKPRLVVLDLGSATAVPEALADGMLDVLSGLMLKQDALVFRGIDAMGFVAPNGDRELLRSTTKKYFERLLQFNMADLSRFGSDVAAKLTAQEVRREELRDLMKSIAYPQGWFYVERAVLLVFGLSASLAPQLNILQLGFPYVMRFVAQQRARRASQQPPPAVDASRPC